MSAAGHIVVYLDYAATTPVDSRVAALMAQCLTLEGAFGNPSSNHDIGMAARARIEHARVQVASLIGAQAGSIVWTSSTTESNNLAILGTARHLLRGRRATGSQPGQPHVITSRTEHKAVLAPCKQLEKEGFRVTKQTPREDGLVHPAQVAEALRPETVLVTIMHVNNELGTINDIGAIGRLCRERAILFHVDAAQSAGKVGIDVDSQNVDLLSLGAHKLYGPKGIGALYVRREPPVGIEPLIFGGGHEHGVRSGTLPTHQIAGMGLACEIACAEAKTDAQRLAPLKRRLWDGLSALGGVLMNPANSLQSTCVPHILNVSFEGVHGESLLANLEGLAVSSGSTCSSAQEPSYVLRALNRSDVLAEASLRFSLGRFTTENDIDAAVVIVGGAVRRLRAVSPAARLPADARTFQIGEAGSVEHGTWIRLLLRVVDGVIAEARFQAFGCPHTLAACQWLVENLPGRSKANPMPEGILELAERAGTPAGKLGRLLIIDDALKAACAD